MDVLLFSCSALLTLGYMRITDKKSDNGAKIDDDSLRQALESGTSLNANERICLVTPDNRPLSTGGLRADMRLHNLWHRATYILVIHQAPHLDHRQHLDLPSKQYGNPLDEEYVLVQKRSLQKDYCPGKLDPTPGGVVGFGESYRENAEREIQEEMAVDLATSGNDLKQLFTFSYQDERVKVWGDFFECTYRGALHDLVLQEEEVDQVLRMSLQELKDRIETTPDDFMPDSCHAMKLYFQRRTDIAVQRRMLKGYRSTNLENYGLRPRPKAIFFDCDDCLYFDNWVTAKKLTDKIEEWCVNHGLRQGQAYELYKQYGTALRGLLAEGYLEESESAIDKYLQDVHDIPLGETLQRDHQLRQMILAMDASIPRYIFTASVRDHALRCLKALGIEDLFVGIIDCKSCDLETKHAPHSFRVAMSVAGVDDPECCLLLDDSVRNIEAARHVGWRGVLVGKVGRDCGKPISSENAELEVDRIHHVSQVLPELFVRQVPRN